MSRVVVVILAIFGVLLVAALVIPFFIPTGVYKTQIQNAAREATGRELVLGGDVKLSLLPPVRLHVEDVTFDNADWASTDHMAQMKSLSIGIDPFAYLFGGKVKVTEFVLRDPVINLEVAKDGRANWEFETAAAAPEETEAEDGGEGVSLKDVMLGDVRLVNGLITYKDASTGETERAEKINATVSLPSLDGPLKVDGDVLYNQQDIDLDLKLEKPRAFLDGQTSNLDMALKSDLIRLSFDGAMAGNLEGGDGLPAQGSGALELDVPSMRKLAAWFGSELPAGKGYGPLNVKGQTTTSGDRIAIDEASIRVDEMKGKGAFALDLGGERPAFTGHLDLNKIDVTPYQSTTAVGQAEQATSGAATGTEPAEGWSNEPIDFSALKAADADLKLTADAIDTGTIKTGKAQVTVNLVNGLLKADLRELGLYDGGGSASFEVNARDSVPTIRNRMNLDAIKALPLFRDLTGMGVLEGVGNFKLDVTSRGRSQREIVQALNGTGSLQLSDGALYGINLARMVRNVDAAIGKFMGKDGINPLQAPNMIQALSEINNVVADLRGGSDEKTDFAEFGGTFRFENGVFKNDDLLLLNPLLRVSGAGLSNLVDRTVDYTVTPRLVGTLKGQGGESGLKGIGIPIRVSGTWDKLVYSLDSRALVKNLLSGKEGSGLGGLLRGGDKEGKEGESGGLLEGLMGGKKKPAEGKSEDETTDTEGAAGETEAEPAKPGDRLRDLFGGGRKETEPEAGTQPEAEETKPESEEPAEGETEPSEEQPESSPGEEDSGEETTGEEPSGGN